MNLGSLVPICMLDCLPGDVIKYSPQAVVRLSPTIAPILHKMEIRFESFFVPNRLLWDKWEQFISGGDNGQFNELPPCVEYTRISEDEQRYPNPDLFTNGPTAGFENYILQKGSLWDYFGLPVYQQIDFVEGSSVFQDVKLRDFYSYDSGEVLKFVSDLPFRAYNLVYNQFYRDENIEPDETPLSSYGIKQRYWTKNDYFTSALPFVLRGVVPSLSADLDYTGGTYPVLMNDIGDDYLPDNVAGTIASSRFGSGQPEGLGRTGIYAETQTTLVHNNNNKQFVTTLSDSYGSTATNYVENVTIPDQDLGGFSLNANEIRWLMQAQKFMERQARGGVRYNEFIMNNFSVATGDYRIDRAEFLGSSRSPIMVSEIPQTSSSTSTSPQGRLAGRGLGTSLGNRIRYRCREYGIFITMMSITPKLSYTPQGISKKWTKEDKFDYFFPQFAHMSEQPIKNSELFFDHSTDDTEPFGYTGIYNEYRYSPDIVTNDFRDTLDYWHMARKFATQPALNESFLKISPTALNRIFAVQDEPPFYVDCYNSLTTYRPIPKFAEPGLVDHF